MVKLFPPGSAVPRVFGLLPQAECAGPGEGGGGGGATCGSSVAVDTVQHRLLGLQSLPLGFSFVALRGEEFVSLPLVPS